MTMTVPSPSRVSPHPEPDGSADRAVLADLCEIARCPISGSRLRPATGAELDDANRSASESWLTHRDGTAVQSGINGDAQPPRGAGHSSFIGDYIGIDSTDSRVAIAWTGNGPVSQDVFSATLKP